MTTADELIRLDHIHKFYDTGGVHALRGISMCIQRGEFLAVMGASGSGKSTLMNIIGCLDRQSAGTYWLDGADVSRLSRHALAAVRNTRLGFVFQGFHLLARTTALENVAMPALYSGASGRERRLRATQALAMLGIEQLKDRFPAQLSGGQQQRVAIARALVNRPSILIADEPTGNLDSRTALEIMEVLKGLNARGLTIVMVTHEADIARFADRTVLVQDGLVLRGEPQRLMAV